MISIHAQKGKDKPKDKKEASSSSDDEEENFQDVDRALEGQKSEIKKVQKEITKTINENKYDALKREP